MGVVYINTHSSIKYIMYRPGTSLAGRSCDWQMRARIIVDPIGLQIEFIEASCATSLFSNYKSRDVLQLYHA